MRVVVYRGEDNFIYEAATPDGLTYSTVTKLAGQSGDALGDPLGYNRGDSSSVVYKCGTNNKTICELRRDSGGVHFRKLTTKADLKTTTMPTPAWNAGNERVIFYTANDGLHALKDPTDPGFGTVTDVLVVADTEIASSPAPFGCVTTSSACNDQNGGFNVVYRADQATSSSIVEMVETPNGSGTWVKKTRHTVSKTGTGAEIMTGDPAVYVATAPWLNTIVYVTTAHQVRALQWDGTKYAVKKVYQ
jgi:hypothetical protein